jgi:hypothetical protein
MSTSGFLRTERNDASRRARRKCLILTRRVLNYPPAGPVGRRSHSRLSATGSSPACRWFMIAVSPFGDMTIIGGRERISNHDHVSTSCCPLVPPRNSRANARSGRIVGAARADESPLLIRIVVMAVTEPDDVIEGDRIRRVVAVHYLRVATAPLIFATQTARVMPRVRRTSHLTHDRLKKIKTDS